MPGQDFGRVADIYDATRSLPESEMTLLLKAFEANVPRGPYPIVDVGVGTGRFAKPLQEGGYDVVGMDVSRAMMAKAVAKGVRGLVLADVQKAPFRDRVFEASVLVHVLHLVGEWASVVYESARISRGSVVSVIEQGDGQNLRKEYREIRTEMGYPLDRFEGGERALMGMVKPLKVVTVAEVTRTTKADDEIKHLEERGQSFTFDLPDGPHGQIIRRLREKYGGTVLLWKGELSLAIWSAESLRTAKLVENQKS